jgi:2-methylcitrate dehydratase PrpD
MGRMVAEMVVDRGGKPESTRWAHGDRLPASEAAFANAIMARWRELDDVHEGTPRLGIGATAGKLLGFDERTVANAMGAAYAHCAGNILSTGDGTRDVWLNAGVGARAGLTAVGRPALGARCLVRERRGREVLGNAWRCRRSRLPATGSLPSSGR